MLGCGGAKPAPPKGPDTAALAAEMDAQLGEVVTIVATRRDDCPRMASELRAVFARMKVTIDRAKEIQKDPALAKQLTTDMRAYDDATAKKVESISGNFTVESTCARDPAVRDAMQTMPTL